jgi:hypothetical protein
VYKTHPIESINGILLPFQFAVRIQPIRPKISDTRHNNALLTSTFWVLYPLTKLNKKSYLAGDNANHMIINRLSNMDCPNATKAKFLSVVRHVKQFGSINDLDLCKIFGETIWSDGREYHSAAFSFKVNRMTGDCEISQYKNQ